MKVHELLARLEACDLDADVSIGLDVNYKDVSRWLEKVKTDFDGTVMLVDEWYDI